jgi:hypothetical protein
LLKLFVVECKTGGGINLLLSHTGGRFGWLKRYLLQFIGICGSQVVDIHLRIMNDQRSA